MESPGHESAIEHKVSKYLRFRRYLWDLLDGEVMDYDPIVTLLAKVQTLIEAVVNASGFSG